MPRTLGTGSNGLLVRSLMSRRFWRVQVVDPRRPTLCGRNSAVAVRQFYAEYKKIKSRRRKRAKRTAKSKVS
jgi:hypothetical protein